MKNLQVTAGTIGLERPLEDDELEMLEKLSGAPYESLVGNKEAIKCVVTQLLLEPLTDYAGLSTYMKALYDYLFELQGTFKESDKDKAISILKQRHFYESTAFIALFREVRRITVVPPLPSIATVSKFSLDIWRSSSLERSSYLTMAMREHYLFEVIIEAPVAKPQVTDTALLLQQAVHEYQLREANVRSLGKLVIDSIKKAITRSSLVRK